MSVFNFVCGLISTHIFVVSGQTNETSFVYLSSSSGSDTGVCGSALTPCATWDYGVQFFDAGDTLIIKDGHYSASSSISITSSGSDTVDIIGESSDDTFVQYENNGSSTLLLIYYDKTITLSNFTYNAKFGLDQRFGYFYFDESIVLSNLIVYGDHIYGDTYGSYDFIYSYYTDDIQASNMTFYDIHNTNSGRYLFDMYRADSVILENIDIINSAGAGAYGRNSNTSNEKEMQFCYIDDTSGAVYIRNISVEGDYYGYRMFSVVDSDWYTST